MFQQIIQSILYTHKNNIVHRDLKPENFLFEEKKEGALIKLIDFGLSTSYLENVVEKTKDGAKLNKRIMTKLKTCAGTSLYMAPEVIMKQYSNACDLWSAGVILYIMLSGYPPFYGENDLEVFEKVINYQFDYEDEVWPTVSDEAKDLINRLLTPSHHRLTAKEVLNHPWIHRHGSESLLQDRKPMLSEEVIRRIH